MTRRAKHKQQGCRATTQTNANQVSVSNRWRDNICFGFIAAAIRLGMRPNGRIWLERAADAATRAMSQPPLHPRDYSWFRAFQLISRELLAGRKPGVDILYRTGLGDWVIASVKKDPIESRLQRGTQLRAA